MIKIFEDGVFELDHVGLHKLTYFYISNNIPLKSSS